MKEYYPDFYTLYARGHENRIAMRAFPQTVNNPTGDNIVLHLEPMQYSHYDPTVMFETEAGQEISQQELKSK